MMQSSLDAFGIISSIAINASNVIIDGHLRAELALNLGLPRVPITRVEHMTDAELRAYGDAAQRAFGLRQRPRTDGGHWLAVVNLEPTIVEEAGDLICG